MKTRLLSSLSPIKLSSRAMSLNEISVALRPFFFEVHPDRFARFPNIRAQNEKSLQIFNGYINDLFPVSTSIKPITVKFSILDKSTKDLQDIKINLSGTDPLRIVRQALEGCNLPTKDLPGGRRKVESMSGVFSQGTSTYEDVGLDQDLLKRYLRHKRKHPMSNDLKAVLTIAKDEVTQKTKESQITKVTLKEDVDDLKWRTGVRDVKWEISWSESHMRRCVTNIHRLLDQGDKIVRDNITNALYKNVLRFGRGSFICCDGSIQFGADNVPEQWQQICEESLVRRTQIPQLHESVARLRSILAGAIILVPNHRGLAQTLQQITSLIVRLNNKPELHGQLGKLSQETMVEVVTSYDELSIGHDGRLLVPCNVDIQSLLIFLQESAEKSRAVNKNLQRLAAELETDRLDLMRELCLQSLEWEEGLSLSAVLACIRRLRDVDEPTRDLLKARSGSQAALRDRRFKKKKMEEENEVGLPQKGLNMIIKDVIPEMRIANESRELFNLCCVEFIKHVASEAQRISGNDQRKTIYHEHVQKALKNLQFPSDYVDAADSVLGECKVAAEKRLKRKNSRIDKCGIPEEELYLLQQQLIQKAREEQEAAAIAAQRPQAQAMEATVRSLMGQGSSADDEYD